MNCKAQLKRTYSEILSAANSCFRSQGFDDTTVSDVCRLAKLSPAEFYEVFESLDDVLDILWEGEGLHIVSEQRRGFNGNKGKLRVGIVNHFYRLPCLTSSNRQRCV